MSADKQIADTLAKFGEPMAGNTWKVQGTTVIYHKALERIAAYARIQFDVPTVIRAERDEAVLMVVGRMADRMEWSIGEALVGTNYRVSGKQAAYVWAMAEKRAKDRVILKLIELHGLVYSEEEADEFKQSAPAPARAEQAGGELSPPASPSADGHRTVANTLTAALKKAKTGAELAKWFADNSATVEGLPEDLKDEVRGAYAEHLHNLKRAA